MKHKKRNSNAIDIMKLDRHDVHDRYEFVTKQHFNISECCQNLINQKPFGNHAFYIFAHTRTEEDGATKRLIWQPRLTKPKAQTNSMLFKAYPSTDNIKVIWMIPAPEVWTQYQNGKMTANQTVNDSINDFLYNRAKLEEKESDDLTDEQIEQIYREISIEAKRKKMMDNLYAKQQTSEAFLKPVELQASVLLPQ